MYHRRGHVIAVLSASVTMLMPSITLALCGPAWTARLSSRQVKGACFARRRGDDGDEYYGDENEYYGGEDDDEYYEDESEGSSASDESSRRGPPRRSNSNRSNRNRNRFVPRRPKLTPIDDLTSDSSMDSGMGIPSPFGRADSGLRLPASVSQALLAGVFVLGIGTGVTVDSQINTNPRDLASRDAVDKLAPNPTLCTTYGASAMAFDQRVFVSFNPFNVYVAQADVKPACVLRQSNVVPVLQTRKLLNDDDIRSCKKNMNTWAFVGDLNDKPQLSCVYQSEDAQNEFLGDPTKGIGEDYLDDDIAKLNKESKTKGGTSTGTRKMVKDDLTGAQQTTLNLNRGGAKGDTIWAKGPFQ